MLIGQERQEAAWIAALASGRMPHAWLLAGPQGIGKAGFAERAARFLVDDGETRAQNGATSLDIDSYGATAKLFEAGGHPELLWMKREVPEAKRPKDGSEGKPEDIARSISIDQVRGLTRRLQFKPALSKWRAVVIDSVDDLERGGANALLKTLEEPPANTVFLLVSHQPGRLLPTIRSRCRLLNFLPLSDAQSRDWLETIRPNMGAQAQAQLLEMAGGSPGMITRLADADFSAMHQMLSDIAARGDRDNAIRGALAVKLAAKGEGNRLSVALLSAEVIAMDYARKGEGPQRVAGLKARDRVQDIARLAQAWSESPATIAYVLGDALAPLAQNSAAQR